MYHCSPSRTDHGNRIFPEVIGKRCKNCSISDGLDVREWLEEIWNTDSEHENVKNVCETEDGICGDTEAMTDDRRTE
jgi:hypothetical protein